MPEARNAPQIMIRDIGIGQNDRMLKLVGDRNAVGGDGDPTLGTFCRAFSDECPRLVRDRSLLSDCRRDDLSPNAEQVEDGPFLSL